jgi:hypothetical protein
MKYRVVGWTSYDDESVEESGNSIGFAERNAIIDDIKNNGYLFSGYDHQEMWDCAPVLNDGKKRCFSQRGWGGVMAEAHGYFGAYDYSLFTFGVNEEYAKRPKNYFFADSFTPEENLAEHFEIEVDESIFALAKTRNPFFLPDLDALRFIDAGDTLTLYCGEESLHFETITDIDRSSSEESEDLPCKIDTKYKIIVSYSKESNLPAPTDESRAVSALLDKMAAEYAAILGENYRERKKEHFEKCRQLAEMLHTSGKITLYAGDCAFSDFYQAINKESGHFTAVNIFCTDSESFYIMGVCRDSTPLFRRLGKDEVKPSAENRWGKIGRYYE